jgi:HSP20 family protein
VAIARWRPANDLASLHSTMDRLFSDVFGDSFGRMGGDDRGPATFHLPVDIQETENGYVIKAPVPGFNPEDVEITFSDGVLTISATHKEEREEPEGQYLRREIAFGNYQRRIALPGDVRAEDIRATFDNGVLTVEVPRAPRPQPRRIQVEPGEQSRQAQSGEATQTDGQAQASAQPETGGSAESGAQAQQESSEPSPSGASSRS